MDEGRVKLSIILATRGRPHLLVPTVRTTLANVRNKDTRLVVMADEDDEDTVLCRPQIERMGASMWVGPRAMSLGEKYNAGVSVEPGDVYMVMVDYAPHITEGFDQRILDAASIYPDGMAVVRNWYANLSFPGLNAVTHRLVGKIGGIYPKHYPFWFVDHHLDDIAQMLGRYVFADVQVDVSARKEDPNRPWTQGRRDTWLWAWLFDAQSKERQALARSIIESPEFDETPARKAGLLNNFPAIAQHSMLVNRMARQDLGAYHPQDDWYDKVRAAGVARLKELLSPEDWAEFQRLDTLIAGQTAALIAGSKDAA
jgi:hypothetical protein